MVIQVRGNIPGSCLVGSPAQPPVRYITGGSVVGERDRVIIADGPLPVVVENLNAGSPVWVTVGYDNIQRCGMNKDGTAYRYGSL